MFKIGSNSLIHKYHISICKEYVIFCEGRNVLKGAFMSNSTYNLRPSINVTAFGTAVSGFAAIAARLRNALAARRDATANTAASDAANAATNVIAIECYPGTDYKELREQLVAQLDPSLVLCADDYAWDAQRLQDRIKDTVTDDRIFGVMSHYHVRDFYDEQDIARARELIAQTLDARDGGERGPVVVYGVGASLIAPDALLVYSDLTRWEITLRFRAGMCNWKTDNADEDPLRKIKRGYFFEWRIADRLKRALHQRIDFLMETNVAGEPKMVDGDAYRSGLAAAATRPFRLVPYFDESVWGGQWMKERFNLDPSKPNYGWSFDGVPEENSIILSYDGAEVEIPAINMVLNEPDSLLGAMVRARYGAEFPIRFDFLDTVGGGNLSLQVHPRTEYIQDAFGMPYTQDESYYILDATDESNVYLGVRDDTTKEALLADLEAAQRGEALFQAEKHVNVFPVKKHDHVLIPAGTIHCSGAGTVVLEISATPYNFTFKLWDWGRLGLDGKPRPINIAHGAPNIMMERDTEFCERELLTRVDDERDNLSDQPGVVTESTGLHGLEPIETQRHWFDEQVLVSCHGSVNMLNLVEGEEIEVRSVDGSFEPMTVHYAETFIVPESVGQYLLVNKNPGARAAVLQAYIRSPRA